jgi:hypothetical protein
MRAGEVKIVNLRHRLVHFSAADIYFPDLAKVLLELHRDKDIEGEVIDFSDSGTRKDDFAVIKVDRISQPLLVPVDRLRLLPAATS